MRVSAPLRVAAVVTSLIVTALPGAVAGPDLSASCEQPYSPVFSGQTSSAPVPRPVLVGAEVPVTRFELTRSLNASGTATIVDPMDTTPFDGVVVQRPEGELRLTGGDRDLVGYGAGDLDGDGNSEIWVGTFENGLEGELTSSFIVPYATASGEHEVAAVGIAAPLGLPLGNVATGETEVYFARSTFDLYDGETWVLSGSELLAPGPGGDASGLDPLERFEGIVTADVAFTEGSELIFGELVPAGAGTAEQSLLLRSVGNEGSTEFTTLPGELAWNVAQLVGPLIAVDGPAGRFLELEQRFRIGWLYIWSYDAPCSALSPADTTTTTGPPTAPSADRTGGAPLSFTG